MRVITFRAAHWNMARTVAEDFFDCCCLCAVIQLRRASVGVDVIDLFGRKLRIG